MADDERPTDEPDQLRALADAARGGDRAAAAELLRALQDTIYRFALSQLADPDAAREATQETAVRLLTAIRRYRGGSRVKTWALGVTLNVCREQRRRRQPAPASPLLDEAIAKDPPTAWRLDQRERAEAINAAIADLSPRQREAIVLRYYEGLSVAETAEAMGRSVGTAKATLFQALKRLRDALPRSVREPHP